MLQTRRTVIGQVTVCSGCCCGAVLRGKPEVPVEWLKREWRSRGLLKVLQLTIAGCMGPCDLTNVVRISGPRGDVWLGSVDRFQLYSNLVDWASESVVAGTLLPLPVEFAALRFGPFSRSIEPVGAPQGMCKMSADEVNAGCYSR
jgi:cobaltochelatase CobN